METILTYGFGTVLLAIAAYLCWECWTYVGQYRVVSGVDPSETPTFEPGETVTLRGRARVREPVSEAGQTARTDAAADADGRVTAADDSGIAAASDSDAATSDEDATGSETGLLAWRIRRRKRKRSSGSRRGRRYRWSTEDAGLDVGRIAVETSAGTVSVDPDAVAALQPDGLGTTDPWESTALHLGEPDERRSVDDPRDFGPDLPVDIDLGPLSTGERSRLEVNRITDGDEILVHGDLVATDDGLAITAGTSSFVLASGTLGDVIGELRAKIAKTALLAAVLLVFAGATFGGYVDGLEFST